MNKLKPSRTGHPEGDADIWCCCVYNHSLQGPSALSSQGFSGPAPFQSLSLPSPHCALLRAGARPPGTGTLSLPGGNKARSAGLSQLLRTNLQGLADALTAGGMREIAISSAAQLQVPEAVKTAGSPAVRCAVLRTEFPTFSLAEGEQVFPESRASRPQRSMDILKRIGLHCGKHPVR